MFNKQIRVMGVMLLTALLLPAGGGSAWAQVPAMPYVSPEMRQQEFWLAKLTAPDKVLLDQNKLLVFNQDTEQRLPGIMFDLKKYPAEISQEQLLALLRHYPLPAKPYYVQGKLAEQEYASYLQAQINENAIEQANAVRFGLTVTRANLRNLPTADFAAGNPDERQFDMFQETALDPAEPVAVLHSSADGGWYFVQSYDYCGWLPAATVAIAPDRQAWADYIGQDDYLVVTGSHLVVDGRTFAMGARLPLATETAATVSTKLKQSWLVKLPVRAANGDLQFINVAVTGDVDVTKGYLPYTRANIVKQAFKMQGESYGWGGAGGLRDCSAFVLDVYRSMGLFLPRNASEQARAAGKQYLFDGDLAARRQVLAQLLPGATLHMNGHVMLYLGENGNHYYIIHNVAARSGVGNLPGPIMSVVVSELSLTLKGSGLQYLEVLQVAKQPE